ncbi:MAG: hypothetical protein MZV70_19725 [Desulfobacterales bacterium]|nr:hypothetical protein [Desulfobacterales bacterium]
MSFADLTPPTAAGRLVSVTGLRRGNRLEVKLDLSRPGEAHRRGRSGGCLTTGEQKVAVILVSMPTRPLLSYVTVDMMRDTYFGTGLSLDGFLRESSNGAAWASGQVLGHVTLDADYIGQLDRRPRRGPARRGWARRPDHVRPFRPRRAAGLYRSQLWRPGVARLFGDPAPERFGCCLHHVDWRREPRLDHLSRRDRRARTGT